jgi:hypothetical protein
MYSLDIDAPPYRFAGRLTNKTPEAHSGFGEEFASEQLKAYRYDMSAVKKEDHARSLLRALMINQY